MLLAIQFVTAALPTDLEFKETSNSTVTLKYEINQTIAQNSETNVIATGTHEVEIQITLIDNNIFNVKADYQVRNYLVKSSEVNFNEFSIQYKIRRNTREIYDVKSDDVDIDSTHSFIYCLETSETQDIPSRVDGLLISGTNEDFDVELDYLGEKYVTINSVNYLINEYQSNTKKSVEDCTG